MKYILLIVFSVTSINAIAGIFGASNYEECVLEKMKGQDRWMLGTARDACFKKFPPEPTEQVIYIENENFSWEQTTPRTILVTVSKAPKDTKLLKADAIFMTADCGDKQKSSGFSATAEKALIGDKFEFKVERNNYKCARITFIGLAR